VFPPQERETPVDGAGCGHGFMAEIVHLGGAAVGFKKAICNLSLVRHESIGLLGLLLLAADLSACNKLVGKGALNGDPNAAGIVGVKQVSTTLDQDAGKTFATISANATATQVVQVPETSPVAGTSLTIQPGTLGIATDVTIELAAPLINPGNTAALGLDGGSTIVGKAVSIQPTQPVDALRPFTVALSVPSASGLNLEDIIANLYVMYKVQNVQKGTVTLGLIPRSALTVSGGTLSFSVSFFGAFQAAVSLTPITAAVQVAVANAPILTQQAAAALPPIAVTARAPFIVKAGSTVTITGKNFRPTMTLAIGGKPVGNLKVASDSAASFTAPTYQGFGLSNLTADQDGSSTQSAVVYYTGTYADFPVSSKPVSEVCAGDKFYDSTGTLQTGSRNCTIAAACTADGQAGCVSSASFPAANAASLASKILSGSTVAGIAGNVTLPAVTNVLSSVSYGISGTGLTGTLTVPTASYVRVTNGAYGAGGTATTPSLTDCASDGSLGCVTVTGYPSAKLANFTASNVASGITVAGVVGSGTSSPASCSADGGTSCVANATYTAALTTGLSSKVLSGNTVAGVGGNVTLPGVSNVLTTVAYGASGTSSVGTLTLPTAANVRTSQGTFGVGGTATTPTLADCNSDGQTGCVTSGILPAAAITGFSTWNIRAGTTLAGVAGTLKTNCRNTVNNTYFNYNGAVGSLPTTGITSGTTSDYWDTTDDRFGWSTNTVTGWSSDTYCDSSTWTDVTTTNGGASNVACGTGTCIYKDQITNLQVTGILASGSNTTSTTTPATYTWSAAVNACAGSTYGGFTAGTWRLPTQKELMSLYEHGIVSVVSANFMSLANMQANYFWSSSTFTTSTTTAWNVGLAHGGTYGTTKTSTLYVSCVK